MDIEPIGDLESLCRIAAMLRRDFECQSALSAKGVKYPYLIQMEIRLDRYVKEIQHVSNKQAL